MVLKILNIDASNRHKLKSKLQTEFDENFDGEKENNYNFNHDEVLVRVLICIDLIL